MPESAIVAAVRASAANTPGRPAVAGDSPSQVLTYSELERQAAAAAGIIGQRVRNGITGLLLPNIPSFATALLGALWAGKTVAVLPTLAPPPLLEYMAAEAGFDTVLTCADMAPRLAATRCTPLLVEQFGEPGGAAAPPLAGRAHAAAVLLYTSGTTGRPKAVALSDHNILSNAAGCREAANYTADDVMLAILPLFHAYGLTVTLLLPLVTGGLAVMQDRFAPRAVLQAIQKHNVTCLVAVPSQYRLIAREPSAARTSSLRLCIAGAERLSGSVAEAFQQRFSVPVLQGYGATEASPAISLNVPHAHRPGTVGRPLPNLRVTVRDGDSLLPPGEDGEIWVEGPSVMLGYFNRPDATAEKIVGGALRTGDGGFVDAEGYLHLAGRADDLAKIAGEKIYPAEVEHALEDVPGVEEVAVLALPDEARGVMLCAWVQLARGTELTEAGLRAACRERLDPVKVPRRFIIVEQLPRTMTGKLDKRAMAAPYPVS